MRNVQCHECGRTYDYDTGGFCPKCGAFTPPLRAEANTSSADDKKQRSETRKESLFGRRRGAEKPAARREKDRKPKEYDSGDLALEILGEVLDVAFDIIAD